VGSMANAQSKACRHATIRSHFRRRRSPSTRLTGRCELPAVQFNGQQGIVSKRTKAPTVGMRLCPGRNSFVAEDAKEIELETVVKRSLRGPKKRIEMNEPLLAGVLSPEECLGRDGDERGGLEPIKDGAREGLILTEVRPFDEAGLIRVTLPARSGRGPRLKCSEETVWDLPYSASAFPSLGQQ
jgi:hypothetical protein